MGKTAAQKILDAHEVGCPGAGVRVISLDRVFCHEITTPIAINDLMTFCPVAERFALFSSF